VDTINAARILIVDDEPQIRRVLRVALIASGYEVLDARSGEEALDRVRDVPPDLILLDMNLPGISGLETCREIRSTSTVPIVMLSVRNSGKDKVSALDAGADDYVTKPFDMTELLARIRAGLRRTKVSGPDEPKTLSLGNLEIDFEKREVTVGTANVHLTPREFDLLRCLVKSAGQPVSHRRLLQVVWGPDYGNEVEYLRVFINQLRKKIEATPSRPQHLLTEPRVGYRFVLPLKVMEASQS
jgi:two-component system, OmpR family, KDP operon response regulator KdpE